MKASEIEEALHPGPFSVVYGGDTGNDNGVFKGGEYPTLKEADKALSQLIQACFHCYYGSEIRDASGSIVACDDGEGTRLPKSIPRLRDIDFS